MKSDQYVARDLPDGWVECPLGQVTLPVKKIDPKKEPDREIDYIDISGIDNSRHVIGNVKPYRLKDAPSRARQVVRSGDVLFATVRPYLRNIATVPKKFDKQIASTGFSVLRPAAGICPAFLFYKTISNDFVSALTGIQYGVSYPAVKDRDVRDQLFGIPPSREQLRIVSKIEELFSELDKGVESLKTARAQLKVYRQAVLKHAFEGKLTAQWREENKDKLETAEQLLGRIKREREKRYEQQLNAWSLEVGSWKANGSLGKRPLKPRAFARPDPLSEVELKALPDLARTWCWTRFGSLFSVYVGATPSRKNPAYWNGIINWISSGEVRFKTIDATKETITTEGLRNTSTVMHPVGTVMLAMIGEGKTRGQAAITNIEACHNQNTAAIRVSEAGISPDYVFYYLLYRYEDIRRVGSGNNQKALNKSRIENLPIPLVPLDEQTIIVQVIDRQLSLVAQSDGEIHRQLAFADTLRQSILRKAFSGELVKQNPNDEPAAVLLERIKAEKASQKPGAKTRQRKVANA